MVTVDHVVPQTFWKHTKLPPNTVKVPQCVKCQKYWDRHVPYFRNLLIAGSNFADHPAIIEQAEIIQRSLDRKDKFGYPILSDYNDLVSGAVRDYRRSPSGIYLEPGIRIDFDAKRFYRTPEKIIRGLLFHLSRSPLLDDYEVRVWPGNGFENNAGYQHLVAAMSWWQTMGDDVFAVRYVRDNGDPNFSLWVLKFYRSTDIMGFTCPKGFIQKSDTAQSA